MTPNEQAMWRDIAEAIAPYCVNASELIIDYFENGKCTGFRLSQEIGHLYIKPWGIDEDYRIFPIE